MSADRIRLARELVGWSQTDLAARVGLTGAAISQYESGANRPSADALSKLSSALDVPMAFFTLPIDQTLEGFFRSLRRSSAADRRRARAMAHIAHDLAATDPASALPTLSVPHLAGPALDIDDAARETIEQTAQQVRRQWRVPSGPIDNVVELLEAHGILVIRLPLGSADVDAFSMPFEDRPVVVLGADKGDRARSRFDAAHELGHLVLHGEQVWGLPEVEKQANYFAAAFLMPADQIASHLPERAEWSKLFALKAYWQVSLAALLMRAKTLNRMTDAAYVGAIKAASARGWRRTEPIPLGEPEQPQLIGRLVRDCANAVQSLPAATIASLAGTA